MATAKKSKGQKTAENAAESTPAAMRQLAQILTKFDALSADEVRTLLAAYSDEECMARGRATRSANTFQDAMHWARTLGEHRDDPAVVATSARWMLDCLSTLGTIRLGEAPSSIPSVDGAITQARAIGVDLFDDVHDRVRDTIGRNALWNARLSDELATPSTFDPAVARLNALATVLNEWLTARADAPALSLARISAATVTELRAAAKNLDDALAKKPAARTLPTDSPAINVAEGRLLFAMRVVWNDFARARKHGRSKLILTVTPTLLRGLDIAARKKSKPE